MPVPDLTAGVPNTDYAYQPPSWFFDQGPPPSGATVFNVLDYGAVANPGVDSTAAIQAAIDAAHAAGGGVVYLPPGVYGINSSTHYPGKSGSLFLESNVFLKGAGMDYAGGQASTLRLMDGASDIITGLVRTNPSAGTSNYGMADITIDGNRANAPSEIVIGFMNGVKATNGDGIPDMDAQVYRVEIKDCSSYGFDPHERNYRLTIEDCVAHGNGKDGFVADYLIDSVFRGNLAFDNDRHGFNLQTSTHDFLLENNVAYGNGGAGVAVQRGNFDVPLVNDVTIRGGSFYDNDKEGIVVRLSENIRIENVDVHGNGTYGIRVKGSDDVSITGSTIANNSQAGDGIYSQIQILEEFDPITNTTFGSHGTLISGNTFNVTTSIKSRYAVQERPGDVNFTTVVNNVINDARDTVDVSLYGPQSTFDGEVSSDAPDVFKGDARDDYFDGKGGNDTISGTAGNDTLLGGAGSDSLDGGSGNDEVIGGLDADDIKGGTGNDSLDGGEANDTITGGQDNDTIVGGSGNDSLRGDSGNDVFLEGDGNDTITGGDGIDTLDYTDAHAAVTIDVSVRTATSGGFVDSFTTIERFIGSTFGDTMLGSTAADDLAGGEGNDTLRGRAGNDVLTGGEGDDTFVWFKPDVVSANLPQGNDRIMDFDLAADVLNFTELLKGAVYGGIGEVVSMTSGAAGTQVAVKIDGGAFVNVVHLDGIQGVTAEAGLTDGWLLA